MKIQLLGLLCTDTNTESSHLWNKTSKVRSNLVQGSMEISFSQTLSHGEILSTKIKILLLFILSVIKSKHLIKMTHEKEANGFFLKR